MGQEHKWKKISHKEYKKLEKKGYPSVYKKPIYDKEGIFAQINGEAKIIGYEYYKKVGYEFYFFCGSEHVKFYESLIKGQYGQ